MADAKLDIQIRAKDDASKELKEIEKNTKELKDSVKELGVVATAMGAATLAAVALSVKKYTEMGSAVLDLSRATGISTEALGEWDYILKQNGADISSFRTAIRTMSGAIADANDGLTTYTRAFDKLEMNYEELLDLPIEKQFETIAFAITELESDTLRMALAQDIFGRGAMDLLPALAQGRDYIVGLKDEARELGIVFDEEAAQKAHALGDTFTALQGSVSGLQITVGSFIGEALQPVVDKVKDVVAGFNNWAKENPELARALTLFTTSLGITLTTMGALTLVLPKLISWLRGLATAIGATRLALLSFVTLGIAAVITAIGMWLSNLNNARETEEALTRATEEHEKALRGEANTFVDAANNAIPLLEESLGRLIEKRKELAETAEMMREQWQVEYKPELKAQLDEQIATLEKEIETLKREAIAYAESGQAIRDNVLTLEDFNELVKGSKQAIAEASYELYGATYNTQLYTQAEVDAARELGVFVDMLDTELPDALRRAHDDEIRYAQDAHDEKMRLLDIEFAAKFRTLDDETNEAIKAIQEQIDAIDEQTRKEQEALDDQADQERLAKLKQEMDTAEDYDVWARAKEQYDELLLDIERKHLLREREAQKDSLRQQIEDIRANAEEQREALQTELDERKTLLDNELDEALTRIETETLALETAYGIRLADTQDFVNKYNAIIAAMRSTAEIPATGSIASNLEIPTVPAGTAGAPFLEWYYRGYQHGGEINEPTLLYGLRSRRPYAIAGEAGTEYVTPSGGETHVHLELDGEELARVVLDRAGRILKLQGVGY